MKIVTGARKMRNTVKKTIESFFEYPQIPNSMDLKISRFLFNFDVISQKITNFFIELQNSQSLGMSQKNFNRHFLIEKLQKAANDCASYMSCNTWRSRLLLSRKKLAEVPTNSRIYRASTRRGTF